MKVESSIIQNKFLRVQTLNYGASLFEVFHKDKKINKWVADKIYDVVKIHRIHEKDLEETRFYLEQAQKKFK